ncbi:MAG: penicillin acylase family protein [Anaerolineae bacterium]
MRRVLRILVILLVIAAVLLGAGVGYGIYTVRRMLPQTTGTLAIPGLQDTVEVYRDAAGVPHIYAKNTHDLFFAQGVITAQDRWWHMEFNRHTALGRISELTGESEAALNNDIFIRTVGWNRAAQADLDALDAESRTVLDDYTAGVNAYLAGKSGADLAVEYSVLGLIGVNIPVEPWTPLDSVAFTNVMSWGLAENWERELEFADLYKKFGDNAEEMLRYYLPPYPYEKNLPIIREGEYSAVADPIVSSAYQQPLVAPGTDLTKVSTTILGGKSVRDLTNDYALMRTETGIGSNNWTISGARTETGKPLLADDPHLGIQMPALWYQVGLHCVVVSADCPYDVVGFTIPSVPGVAMGHNGRIAWGVTNVGPDTQDLYVIKVDPNDDLKYELDGKMVDMQVVEETIKIGGVSEPKTVRVRITRWGSIITDTGTADEFGQPLALRWAPMEKPDRNLTSILKLNRASDWDSFREALSYWDTLAQNFVYADVDGNIGYQTTGWTVIRAEGHSGLTPVDGSTTKYDWKGYYPREYLPHLYNPGRGYISTANQAVVPEDYYTQVAQELGSEFGDKSNYTISTQWAYGQRSQRIVNLIEATAKHTPDTVAAIHGDDYSTAAATLLPAALPIIGGVSEVPKEVTDWLASWTDYQMKMDSGPAALSELYFWELCKHLWGDELGFVPGDDGLITALDALLNNPDQAWWDDVTTTNIKETRDDILKTAYIAAYQEAVARMGSDYKQWSWGKLHTATFVSNPLGQSGIDLIENFVNGGPVPVSGGRNIVNATGYSAGNPFSVRSLPSFRMIVDFSNFDNSRWIITTGISGHPTSPHYRDQIDKWRFIEYNNMPFTLTAVKNNAVETLTLTPKN